jgi:acetyl-CoA carboxylase biotin carboxyl carrier protein
MNLEFIERLIDIVERHQVAELEYSEGDCRVRIGLRPFFTPLANTPLAPSSKGVPAENVEKASTPAAAGPKRAGHTVSSSLVGVFYRSPAPGKACFVEVGDVVEEGQTMAIVEAMKMLNPIEADRRGRISAILKTDGEMIEAGQPLFTIESVE